MQAQTRNKAQLSLNNLKNWTETTREAVPIRLRQIS